MHLGRFAALSSLPLLAPAEWIVAQSPPSNPAPAPCWVVDKVKKILVQQLGLKPSQITLQSSLVELGVDSLDQVELVMACEEEFDIEIKESEAGLDSIPITSDTPVEDEETAAGTGQFNRN